MNYDSSWRSFTTNADEQSLKELFMASYGDLCAYGGKISGNTSVVKDAIQEVFLNLWKYRENLNSEAGALPYLFKSLRNEIIRIRKKFAVHEPLTHDMASFEFSPGEYMDDALDGYEKKQIIDALNSLPPRQREILYLKFYEDFCYEDIASILEIRYQSVVNQSFRAINKLREHASLRESLFAD